MKRVPILVLIVFGAAAYWNTLTAPFIFDDRVAILANPTIREFGTALSPPRDGSAVTGRPVVNLSFALNYAAGGFAPAGYHAVNLGIHLGATLLLYGIVRRTLARPHESHGSHGSYFQGDWTALAVALVWELHPLQTESVTSVVQRTESLAGFFYLAMLYCFVRGPGRRWLTASVIFCTVGMASKEVMATAPLVVLLYDRTFVAGSFAAAWRARRGYYLALAATWLILAWLVISTGAIRRGSSASGDDISSWSYLLTQAKAIGLYLRLSVVPHPLVLDYGTSVVAGIGEVVWPGLLLLGLLAGTVVALRVRPRLGFLGAWFFLTLAPSSSFIPLLQQTIAEHRMYLAMAPLAVLAVLALRRLPRGLAAAAGAGVCVALAATTYARNQVYRDAISIWADTVEHRPENGRARLNLAQALYQERRFAEAEREARESLRLKQTSAACGMLALALEGEGRRVEAIAELRRGLAGAQFAAHLHTELGRMLLREGRTQEAGPELIEAIRLDATMPDAHLHLGSAFHEVGRIEEAAQQFAEAARLDGQLVAAHFNLGVSLLELGRPGEAIAPLERALALEPNSVPARDLLARARAAKWVLTPFEP